MINTQLFTETLVIESCFKCGIRFGVPKEFREECLQRRAGKDFYCPNGHGQHFIGKTEAQVEREAREKAEQQAQWAREDAARQRKLRETAERSASASRAHFRRIKTRVAHGVCPCCSRSFLNLARHMSGKHPEWKKGSGTP